MSLKINPDDVDVKDHQGKGMKYDAGKLQAGIVFEDFPYAVQQVMKVATMGANKYARSSWKTVEDAHRRYTDAFFRHLIAIYLGEEIDQESGLPHRAHVAWNALALLELERL